MNNISRNISNLKTEIEKIKNENNILYDIRIVAATKYANCELIKEVLKNGISILSENKIQDARKKIEELSAEELKWHFIGHLQKNKVNKAVQYFDMIQSVDSVDLLDKIDRYACKIDRRINVLLQVNIAKEESKYGFEEDVLLADIEELFSFKYVDVKGIMIIAPYFDNPEQVRKYFRKAKHLYDTINIKYKSFEILSMGMSNDYKVAIEEGSNMIRVGSLLFQ
ncbi:MAG: YggS family pyridoxal phosphate-dependent enzyme [bacterium]|nr:YggS family pyridoxal phosphate-dependent enzyme [bacterium]